MMDVAMRDFNLYVPCKWPQPSSAVRHRVDDRGVSPAIEPVIHRKDNPILLAALVCYAIDAVRLLHDSPSCSWDPPGKESALPHLGCNPTRAIRTQCPLVGLCTPAGRRKIGQQEELQVC